MTQVFLLVLILGCFTATASAIFCRQCMHAEVYGENNEVSTLFRDVMIESGMWDPSCQLDGVRHDSFLCVKGDQVCVSSARAASAEQNGKDVSINLFQRFCLPPEDKPAVLQCYEAEDDTYSDVIVNELGQAHMSQFSELKQGTSCFCDTYNCNNQTMQVYRGHASGHARSVTSFTIVFPVLIGLLGIYW